MDKGTKVYRAYVSCGDESRFLSWIDEATVTEIVKDGVPFVSYFDCLQPLDERWRETKSAAQRDVHAAMVRFIGRWQAKADALADEILHADLSTEEAAA